jgi:hypothetical protein
MREKGHYYDDDAMMEKVQLDIFKKNDSHAYIEEQLNLKLQREREKALKQDIAEQIKSPG